METQLAYLGLNPGLHSLQTSAEEESSIQFAQFMSLHGTQLPF